jgi:hypothetical protein
MVTDWLEAGYISIENGDDDELLTHEPDMGDRSHSSHPLLH